jgi:3-oxoacyl-[acyl-carrier-protein] synthase II
MSPLGITAEANWHALTRGLSGINFISSFDTANFPIKAAGEVKDFRLSDIVNGEGEKLPQFLSRATELALGAALMAVHDAQAGDVDKLHMGVCFASGKGSVALPETAYLLGGSEGEQGFHAPGTNGNDAFNPMREMGAEYFSVSEQAGKFFGAIGPNFSCYTACAAGTQAIGLATEIIRRGEAEIMLAGGADSQINPLSIAEFALLNALSTESKNPARACRPFDAKRNGFVIGEGAGVLILESLPHALRRGATIYAEVIGHGSSLDAYGLTKCHPEARGAILSMKVALDDAGIAAEDIDYINAHGTGTVLNDKMETRAIKEVFKERAYQIPMTSTKAMTGHLLAAAGAVELVFCLLAMKYGIIPPTINYENYDPECDLDYVANRAREADIEIIMSNNFGFGGQNSTAIMRRYHG